MIGKPGGYGITKLADTNSGPLFSRFHDGYRENPESITLEGDMRTAFFAAYEEDDCEYLPLRDPKIDERLKSGPELVSANFVIPYPPGFPIMVPGQVIAADTIGYMRKLDVKEIHGYNHERGLKLIKLSAIPPSNGKGTSARGSAKQSNSERKTAPAAQSKAKSVAKQ
jgi:arginine decarboxylase